MVDPGGTLCFQTTSELTLYSLDPKASDEETGPHSQYIFIYLTSTQEQFIDIKSMVNKYFSRYRFT